MKKSLLKRDRQAFTVNTDNDNDRSIQQARLSSRSSLSPHAARAPSFQHGYSPPVDSNYNIDSTNTNYNNSNSDEHGNTNSSKSQRFLGFEISPQRSSSGAKKTPRIHRHHVAPHILTTPPLKSNNDDLFQKDHQKDLISQLPYELIYQILNHLDVYSLVTLGQVNQHWRAITMIGDEWHRRMQQQGWPLYLPSHWQFFLTSSHQIDWRYWYLQRWRLAERWRLGQVTAHYLLDHTDSVYCVQFDDRKIISGSRDHTIKIWNAKTYQCVHTLSGHEGSVLCLQYDRHHLVSGSSDATVIVWCMRTLQTLMRIRGHTAKVSDVCFNEKYIVSGSKDSTIRISSLETGDLIRVIHAHNGPVNSVKMFENKIVSGSRETVVKMWDIDTGECLREFIGHTRGLACVDIQDDGRIIVSGANDQTIKVWNAETGECMATCEGHTGLVRAVCFSKTRIVSSGYDQSIRVWDATTGTCLLNFQSGHSSWIFDVKFDDKRIVSSSQDGRILVMDFAEGLDTRFICR